MSNPWLDLSLEDYEGHMNSPEVQQLSALSELFAEVLAIRAPASVAALGVAGGNGLDRIDTKVTRRTVGIDINPRYLDMVRLRHSALPGLELHCVDLANDIVNLEPVDLVHAALVFEHAGIKRCLDNTLSLVTPRGAVSVVLQMPSPSTPEVAATAFPAMQRLKSHFCLVDPRSLTETLKSRNFQMAFEQQRSLPTGKAFWLGIFTSTLA